MRSLATVALAIVLGASVGCATTHAGARKNATEGDGPTNAALVRLAQRPDWLFPFFECPADVFPGAEAPDDNQSHECANDLQSCLDRCQSKDPSACYFAALNVQATHVNPDYSEALFLRACRLGVTSGCTNRAAGMVYKVSDASDAWKCANRTFQAMCDRNDPWACTMWGASLLYGRGVDRDVARARDVLPRACRYGQDDPACKAALEKVSEAKAASK